MSSSFKGSGEGQSAGAHSGLNHQAAGPLNPQSHAVSGEDKGQVAGDRTTALAGRRGPLALPFIARPEGDSYLVVDSSGLIVAERLTGRNSAAAIANTLDGYARRDGICLSHLSERRPGGGTCFSCWVGAWRHPYSVVA